MNYSQTTTVDKDTARDMYSNGVSIKTIADIYEVSTTTITRHLKQGNVAPRKAWASSRKLVLKDERFFEKIDTEEKAYWLGFIATDGNIMKTRRRRTLYIGLQASDITHLSKLSMLLYGEDRAKIRKSKGAADGKSCYLRVCSTALVDDLIANGITPNKTFTVKPWVGPSNLMRHYWRGCVDGDGCLRMRDDGQKIFGFVGNEYMVSGMAQYLTANIEHDYEFKCRPKSSTSIYEVCSGGNTVVGNIYDLLYKDSNVSMDRKLKIYQSP